MEFRGSLLLPLVLVLAACLVSGEDIGEKVALRGARASKAEAAPAAEPEAGEAPSAEIGEAETGDDGADEEDAEDGCEASRELCGDYCTYNDDGQGRQRCAESPECRVLDVKDFGGKPGDEGWLCESADLKCREFEVLSPEHFTCQHPGQDEPQWEDDSAFFEGEEGAGDLEAQGALAAAVDPEEVVLVPASGNETSQAVPAVAEPVAALAPQAAALGTSGRCHRGSDTKTLYHLTDRSACEAILHGGFKLGRPGIAGRGVYFAVAPSHTFGKAECPACKGHSHERPCMIEAQVRVGRSKHISFRGDRGLSGPKLWSQCYDSAWIPRGHPHGSKPEYVVYNPRQVRSLCVYPVDRHGQAVGSRRCRH